MSLTLNSKVYTESRVNGPDSQSYASTDNTLSHKSTLELKRVYPKPTATFDGVARPTVKLVETQTINSENVDASLTLTGSFPVGMSGAAITDLQTRMRDHLIEEIAGNTTLGVALKIGPY
jgi:hypothetical protein